MIGVSQFHVLCRAFPRRAGWAFGCLLLATVAAYLQVFSFDFVNFDDDVYVTNNKLVQTGLSARGVWYAFTTFDLGNWIPLTWLSYELDFSIFGLNSAAFHASNLFWHGLNSCLLYLVLRLMTHENGCSLAVALLFAVHPLHVESVAWVSERKDVLSTFWLLISLLAYRRYAVSPTAGRMTIVCGAMTLGLMAKPMLVTLPLLLLLIDFWPLGRLAGPEASPVIPPEMPGRSLTSLVIEKIPLFLIAFAVGCLTIQAQNSAQTIRSLEQFPLLVRILNPLQAYGWYLTKTFWPTHLCAYYDFFATWGELAVAVAELILVSLAVWACWRHRPWLAFGWLWFLVSLAPVIGILRVGSQAYADRYAYVPHIGLLTLVVWQVWDWLKQWHFGGAWARTLTTVAVLIGITLTARQAESWRNSQALWEQALRVNPDNPMALYQLAMTQMQAGDLDAALKHLRRAVALDATDPMSLYAIGSIHHQRADWDQAVHYYQLALRLDPDDPYARRNLALAQHHAASTAVATSKTLPQARLENQLGLREARAGQLQAALDHFEKALALDDNYSEAHNNAGLALKELHRTQEAREHFEKAILISPDRADYHFNFALMLDELGDVTLARAEYARALELQPQDLEIKRRLENLDRARTGSL